MALKSIYLDMDGVLVDMCAGVARAVGIDPVAMYGPLNNHWSGIVDVLTEETGEEWTEGRMLEMFRHLGHRFWAELPKYEWADELYALCNETAPTVIMTSPADIPTAASGKMEWMFENLPNVERYSITSCKHHLSHPDTLLIDDSTEFCGKFEEHGGRVYLFPQPWSDPEGWNKRNALEEIRELLARLAVS